MNARIKARTTTLFLCALAVSSPVFGGKRHPPSKGSQYVAMGSSFASGAGISPYEPASPNRCQRSAQNYAHQLARKRNLVLVDASCAGASTAHITGPWRELAAQVDALTPETALVTVTIGGNDIGYIGGLMAASCRAQRNQGEVATPMCRVMAAGQTGSASVTFPTDDVWQKLAIAFAQIAAEIHHRSPHARIIFVDYLTVIPKGPVCAQMPLSTADATTSRAIAARLARLTDIIARHAGAEVLSASRLSRNHNACAGDPWSFGFLPPENGGPFMQYHPNLAGMTAITNALDRKLGR